MADDRGDDEEVGTDWLAYHLLSVSETHAAVWMSVCEDDGMEMGAAGGKQMGRE